MPSGKNSEPSDQPGAHAAVGPTEFRFTDAAFARVRAWMKAEAGIDIGAEKRMLVYGRLARRLRTLGLDDFDAYLARVEANVEGESEVFLNSLTTNVTEFFREPHHFEMLRKTLLPSLWQQHARDRRVRIWSAGCSTGEEPYSLAMVVDESCPAREGWDVKILATDIDSNVLAHAKEGVYPLSKVEKLPPERVKRHFLRGGGDLAKFVKVKPTVASLVTFMRLNLMHNWPMSGPFDVVMCRNVVIYFDTATRNRLIRRYQELLAEGGHLFLGHSETLVGGGHDFESAGPTVYRRRVRRPEAA